MKKFLLAAFSVSLLAQTAFASFNLQITEIFPGQGGSNDLTEDWFEITNFGSSPWNFATDGGLWFDDVSAAVFEIDGDTGLPEDQAVPLEGITSIAAGESVIFVEGGPDEVTAFNTVWGAVLSSLPQVGFHSGSGLSGNGDAVTIFLDADLSGDLSADTAGAVAAPDVVLDFEAFPEVPVLLDGSSFDVVLQEFSTTGSSFLGIPATPNAVASIALGGDDLDTPVVGSPGSVIPEPSSLALVACGLLGMLSGRRKR